MSRNHAIRVPLPADAGSSMNTLCSHCGLFIHTLIPQNCVHPSARKMKRISLNLFTIRDTLHTKTADLNRDLYLYIAQKWY
jgi:hypothetical protein